MSNDLWTEVELTTPVPIDITKELWITVYHAIGDDATFPAGIDYGIDEPNGNLLTIDGTTWDHLSDLGQDGTWSLRGFVTDVATNKTVELGEANNSATYKPDALMTFEVKENTTTNTDAEVNVHKGTRSLAGYNIYRTACETGELQFLGFTPDEYFIDTTWSSAENGSYKWGIIAVYDENSSEINFSNCLNKIIEDCVAPSGLTAVLASNSATTVLTWNMANTVKSDVSGKGIYSFLGYNIYRDGTQINSELVLENTYQDTPGTPGNYCYTVTAVYSLCGESEPSNEECIDILVGINDQGIANNRVYPNPTNSVLNIELSSNISQVVVYNYVGQVVFEKNVTKSETIQLNTRNYESGTYLIKLLTNSGENFIKKVVVTK
jgi:hypothetical protein